MPRGAQIDALSGERTLDATDDGGFRNSDWRSVRRDRHAGFDDPRFVLIDLQTFDEGTLAVWFGDGLSLPMDRTELQEVLDLVVWSDQDVLFLGEPRPDSAIQVAQLATLAALILPAKLHVAQPGVRITAADDGQVRTVDATTGEPVDNGLRIIEPEPSSQSPTLETSTWFTTHNGVMILGSNEPAILQFPQGLASVSYADYRQQRAYFAFPRRLISGLFELWLDVDAQDRLALRAPEARIAAGHGRGSGRAGAQLALERRRDPARGRQSEPRVERSAKGRRRVADDLVVDGGRGGNRDRPDHVDADGRRPGHEKPKDWKPLLPSTFPADRSPSFESVNGVLQARSDMIFIPMNGGAVNVPASMYVQRLLRSRRARHDPGPTCSPLVWLSAGKKLPRVRPISPPRTGGRQTKGSGSDRRHQAPGKAQVRRLPPQWHRALVQP